ncbi:MAG: hypothetical protein AAF572_18420 [Cyanobacteria bacterium P01_B01_bin.77]
MDDKGNQSSCGLQLYLSEKAVGTFVRTILVLCVLGAQIYDLPLTVPVDAVMGQLDKQFFSGE